VTDAIMEESLLKKPTRRERINSDHRQLDHQKRYRDATVQLKRLYTDKTKQRARGIDYMIGVENRGQPFEAFYEKYRAITEKHNQLQRRQNQVSAPKEPVQIAGGPDQKQAKNQAEHSMGEIAAQLGTLHYEFEEMADKRQILDKGKDDPTNARAFKYTLMETSKIQFSHEEDYGKYLNLHKNHLEFLNIKGIQKSITYAEYAGVFANLEDIPIKIKGHPSYKKYLDGLLEYLSDYLFKVNPLHDQKLQEAKLKVDFEDEWQRGSFRGWAKAKGAMKSGAHLPLDDVESADDLKALGLERLKSALQALGLKCGGTLDQRAERLFSVKGLTPDQIPAKIKVKGAGKQENSEAYTEREREVAWREAKLYNLVVFLTDYKDDTVENIQRKMARTTDELMEEDDDESDEEIEKVDDTIVNYNPNEEEIIYNPKNLPLDWDGKPIPYWLYKLHGLNISYPCEICGGHKYKGLKPFQKHFAEWRHAHGMRCLGIPNTAHFVGVTQIKEAQQLWAKLKAEKTAERFNPETEEEFEDNLGNVLNKKTFDDLRRQGLC